MVQSCSLLRDGQETSQKVPPLPTGGGLINPMLALPMSRNRTNYQTKMTQPKTVDRRQPWSFFISLPHTVASHIVRRIAPSSCCSSKACHPRNRWGRASEMAVTWLLERWHRQRRQTACPEKLARPRLEESRVWRMHISYGWALWVRKSHQL